MDLGLALALIGATTVLVAIPGPNVLLIIANTVSHGARYGVVTVLGTTIGLALQVFIVVIGFAAMLEFASFALHWIKWLGVAYLVILGIASWRRGISELHSPGASDKPIVALFWQGLLLATMNPKTLLFNAAFLPQFAGIESASNASILLPAMIYLTVVFLGDMIWVASARSLRSSVAKLGALRHRLTGCLFIGSGIGLALANKDQ